MANGLSPQNEQYLDSIVAVGMFASKEAALDAAVAALREKNETLPVVPEEHLGLVEQALASGNSRPLTEEDWTRLRRLAHDVAARRNSGDA